jgi:hypothetical protein
MDMDPEERITQRIEKYEKMGRFEILLESQTIDALEPERKKK